MKLVLLLFTSLLLLQCSPILLAELQGPQLTSATPNPTTDEPVSANEDKQLQSSKNSIEHTENDEAKDDGKGNVRKASNYIADQVNTPTVKITQIVPNILGAKPNNLHSMLFERWLNGKVIRQKLQEQIDEITSKREPIQTVDPTPEEIEGNYNISPTIDLIALFKKLLT